MKRGQTLSMDAIVAIGLFALIIIFFFSVTTDRAEQQRIGSLESETTRLLAAVSSIGNDTSAFIQGSKVDAYKIALAANLTYAELKTALGITSDFCIHFEDANGNIINISGNVTGLGSSLIKINGTACS